ncbi:lipoprotein lppR [Mycolicibacterium fortuitum]|uniref:Lipoprotein lppR n=1 Tax=Mycolicibacterium fortuitum TaxID=1766 RepID=A0A378USB6_MYCFO|nr:lipoprotein lppR [Mycolicibacterium fortuitum]
MRAQKSRYAGLPEGASVSFSRYGGPPADPFGGQPFGGWPGPPSEPPVFHAPPPQARETNPLATLSIVFAFLFAPAGAVLGHVALSQIKRLHQQGRDRAIIGLALSYFILLLLVVALVVWLVLPRESNSSNVSVSKHSIKDFLLSGPELGELFDQSFDDLPRSSSSGGFDRMPDATNPNAGAQPVDCVSPVTPADRNAYRSAGVTEFASQVWPNRLGVLDQRVLSVTEMLTTLPSVESAETLVEQLTQTWKRCEGQTVTFWGTRPPGAGYLTHKITDVRTEGPVLAATIRFGRTEAPQTTPQARAVMAKENFVIETEVAFYDDVNTTRDGTADPQTSGIALAKAIADKIEQNS